MLDLLLTVDGDLDVSGHGVRLIGGGQRVAQQVRTAMRVFLGEWDFNLDEGVPWFQSILGRKDVGLNDVENILRDKIQAVTDVRSIKSFAMTFDVNTRRLTIRTKIDTTFGPVSVEGVFP